MSIAYRPEEYGAEIVAELDIDEPYEFDTVLVLRDVSDGKLYAQHDEGCSCPTPFEEFTNFPSDFIPITKVEDLRTLLDKQSRYRSPSPADTLDFILKVRAAL